MRPNSCLKMLNDSFSDFEKPFDWMHLPIQQHFPKVQNQRLKMATQNAEHSWSLPSTSCKPRLDYSSGQVVSRISHCNRLPQHHIRTRFYLRCVRLKQRLWLLMPGDTSNFWRQISLLLHRIDAGIQSSLMKTKEGQLLCHRSLLVLVNCMLMHLGKGQNLSCILKSCWVQAIAIRFTNS